MSILRTCSFVAVSSIFFQTCLSNPGVTRSRELQAIKIVQELLKTQKPLKHEPLVGGLSEASLIKITSDDQEYVVRFLGKEHFGTSTRFDQEIACQQIASDNGYGPHVYGSDNLSGYVVMQYMQIECFPGSKNLLSAHVDLVKKIHSGPAFPVTFKYFDHIREDIKELEEKKQNIIDLVKIKTIIDKIDHAVSCFSHDAPCHRDLHPGNILYSRGQFFAIDYTLSGQDDPFIDLSGFIFHGLSISDQTLLLHHYFGRLPTKKELAKLSLMRLAVLIFHGVSFSRNIPEAFLQSGLMQAVAAKNYLEILDEFEQGSFDLSCPSGQVEFVRAMFSEVLRCFDSDQFNKEIALLES